MTAEPTTDAPSVELADYFAPEQITQLLAAINPSRVNQKDGQSHLEAYDVRAHLNRILGFGRWDGEVVHDELLFEDIYGEKTLGQNNRWDDQRRITVGYRVRYRLVVKAPDGTPLASYTEVAAGDANNFPGSKRADAHDFAVKTAESQALKRCAINLGDQFGLSLYRKGSTSALVLRTLVGMPQSGQKPPAGQVDEGAPDVVPEEHPEHGSEPTGQLHSAAPNQPATPPPAGPEIDKAAQALADLAAQMPTVERLKNEVYDAAKGRRLLAKPVLDPMTGDPTVLSQVITDAKAHLTPQTEQAGAVA